MVLQMRNVLKKHDFMIERNAIEEHEMLMNLAHVAHVWHDRQIELFGHDTYSQEFADSAEAGAVCLHKIHSSIEEIILEYDPVRDMLSRRDANRREGARKLGMGVNVIRMRRLFDP